MQNKEQRNEYAERARERAMNYTTDAMADQYLNVYQRAIRLVQSSLRGGTTKQSAL
jgi:glycosyltransferase involved in cell wall biosynthesis